MKTDFPNGVLWYSKRYCVLEVNFPEDAICCQNCEWRRCEKEFNRYFCRITGKQIYNPFYAVDEERCPLMTREDFAEAVANSFITEVSNGTDTD